MQKLPEALDRKRGDTCTEKELFWEKKESCSLLTVTTPKCFLRLVEGTMRPSLDEVLVNLSSCSSRLFY